MDDLKVISMVNNFPIGKPASTREELLSKAEIISFLARMQEQFLGIENVDEREDIVKKYLGDILNVKEGEAIPYLSVAEKILQLSSGFIQDMGKIQIIKENNPDFNETFNLIAGNLNLTDNQTKSR